MRTRAHARVGVRVCVCGVRGDSTLEVLARPVEVNWARKVDQSHSLALTYCVLPSPKPQVLNAKLDRALFEEMDADGSGDISKDEFLLYMLENLGLVEMGQLRRLESRFNELEESGVLDSYLASKQAEAAEADTEVGAGEDETKDVGAAALQEAAGEESEVAVSPLMAGLAAENGPAQQASVPPPAESPGSAKIKLAPIAGRRKVRIAPEPEAEQDEGGAANDEAT